MNVLMCLTVALLLTGFRTSIPAAAVNASYCPDLSPAANNASSITIATPVVIRAPCTFTNVRLSIDVLGAQSSTAAPTTAITIDGAAFYHDPAHTDGVCVSATGVAGITKPVLLTVRNSHFEMLPGAVATTKVLDFVAISSFSAGMLPAGSAITIQNNTFRAAWIALSGSGALLVGALLLRGDLVLVSSNVTFAENRVMMENVTGQGVVNFWGVRAIAGGGPTTNLLALNRSMIILADNSVVWRRTSLVYPGSSPVSHPYLVILLHVTVGSGPPGRRINLTISGEGSALVVDRNTVALNNQSLLATSAGFVWLDYLFDLLIADTATLSLGQNAMAVTDSSVGELWLFTLFVSLGTFAMRESGTSLALEANTQSIEGGNITTARVAALRCWNGPTAFLDAAHLRIAGHRIRLHRAIMGTLHVVLFYMQPGATSYLRRSQVEINGNEIAILNTTQRAPVTSMATLRMVLLSRDVDSTLLVLDALNRIVVSGADFTAFVPHQDLSIALVELGTAAFSQGSELRIDGGIVDVAGRTRARTVSISGIRALSSSANASALSLHQMRVVVTNSTIQFLYFDFAVVSAMALNANALFSVFDNCGRVHRSVTTSGVTIRAIAAFPSFAGTCGNACVQQSAASGVCRTASSTVSQHNISVTPRVLVKATSTATHSTTSSESDSLTIGKPSTTNSSPKTLSPDNGSTPTPTQRFPFTASDALNFTTTAATSKTATPSETPPRANTTSTVYTRHTMLRHLTNSSRSHSISRTVALAGPRRSPPTTADPGPAAVTGTAVAVGVIGAVSAPVSTSAFSSIQLLAIFSVMACQVPGAGDGSAMQRFLTPVGLDGRSGALAGNVLVAAGMAAAYGAVFAALAGVLRSRERARRLLRHPQALPLLHLLTLPGLAFEAATLLYGDAAATAGERVFGGAVLALCCASAGAYGGVSAYYHARVAPLEATVVRPRWGSAELAARVPRAVRALLVPAAGWAEGVRADPRCVYAGLRPMTPAAHHAVAGHSALRVLLVCVVCAVRPGAEWHCTAVLSVAGVVCAAHAALLLALRPLRIPVSNPLQAAESGAVGGVAFIRAGNGPVAVATAFTITLVVASLLSSAVAVAAVLAERHFELFPEQTEVQPSSDFDAPEGTGAQVGMGSASCCLSFNVSMDQKRDSSDNLAPVAVEFASRTDDDKWEGGVSQRTSPIESAEAIALNVLVSGS